MHCGRRSFDLIAKKINEISILNCSDYNCYELPIRRNYVVEILLTFSSHLLYT